MSSFLLAIISQRLINHNVFHTFVIVSHQEVTALLNLIHEINEEKDSVVVVEGKRDSYALKCIGFSCKILEFHRFGGLTKFSDSVSGHKNIILLFDSDRKGRYLTRRVIEQLERRAKINLYYKKRLNQITGGKIRTIEEISQYEDALFGAII
ncbi:putative Toprim domain protein (Modular protein) [Candidatus Nitrosotenuis uzonensis]|uniref:Putative Toprim domain protein (Modular protein) n=1 Tax=Candidatus Nitrosotenuis uzonensis TaxID=1407055 RepID=A0A812F3A5_9ARCH|nr:putative Toprim domain protein (Modular protein) [Candidatus Nitrosotenuis uzonensis]